MSTHYQILYVLTAVTSVHNNMLTIGNGDEQAEYANRTKNTDVVYENIRLDNKDDNIGGCTCFCKYYFFTEMGDQ